MTWQHPFVLALGPIAIITAWWLFRCSAADSDGVRFPNIRQLWADRHGLSDGARPLAGRARGIAFALAAVLALAALARPQWGEIPEVTIGQAREVMIGLDLSRSMLADDVSPNRLARAKLLVEALLDQLHGERVGLTVFAGTAFVQSPLSADYEVLREFLAELDPTYLPQGGTDYAAMLRATANGFGEQGGGDRYLVVLSDGEAHDEGWQRTLPTLRARGIRVVGLGVGTPAGALVPNVDGGALTDEQGNAVLSKLEPKTLQQLAEQTGGTYRDAAAWVDIADLVGATVAQGQKGDYIEERHVRLQDRFQWFLAPALLVFLLSYWLEFPVFPLARALQTRGRRPHRASAPAIAAVLVGLVAWYIPIQAHAVVTDEPPPPSVATVPQPVEPPPVDLAATVAELSDKPVLGPSDYARLATDTIGFAAQPSAPRGTPRDGIIDDALAAVDRGEAQDTAAADWPALRQQLKALRTVQDPPPPPPQDQQQQQDQPNKPCDNPQSGGGNQQESEQQQGGAGQGGEGEPKADQQNAEPQQSGAQNGNEKSADQQNTGEQDADEQTADSSQGGGDGAGANQANAAPQDGEQPVDSAADGTRTEAKKDDASERADDEKGSDDAAKDERSAQSQDSAQEAQEESSQPRSEVLGAVERRDDVQPLEGAGLGDEKPAPEPAEVAAAPSAQQPDTAEAPKAAMRLVGGGQPAQQGDPASGAALARMQQVKEGDSPAVLFERMNRADGQQPPSEPAKKNW